MGITCSGTSNASLVWIKKMTAKELDFFFELVGKVGLGFLFGAVVIYIIIKNYIPSYLQEKAKNLATKEDIQDITDKVEGIRFLYASNLEEVKGQHQLKLAAIDKRLQVHQEAFTLWREILGAVYTDEINNVVVRCQSWWEKNCLYLEPKVREAFVKSYSASHMHRELTRDRNASENVERSWDIIVDFPKVLFEAIQLPPLSKLEIDELQENAKKKHEL